MAIRPRLSTRRIDNQQDDRIAYQTRSESYVISKQCEATLGLNNCNFITDTIDCLGRFLRSRQLMPGSQTTDAKRGLKPSTSITELRSVMDVCNVLQQFFSSFAGIMAPLNQRFKKEQAAAFLPLHSEGLDGMKTL